MPTYPPSQIFLRLSWVEYIMSSALPGWIPHSDPALSNVYSPQVVSASIVRCRTSFLRLHPRSFYSFQGWSHFLGGPGGRCQDWSQAFRPRQNGACSLFQWTQSTWQISHSWWCGHTCESFTLLKAVHWPWIHASDVCVTNYVPALTCRSAPAMQASSPPVSTSSSARSRAASWALALSMPPDSRLTGVFSRYLRVYIRMSV